MILIYEAIGATGQRTSDTVEAADSKEAVGLLRRRGLFVTRIEEQREKKSSRTPARKASRTLRLPLNTLMLFTRQMAMLLRAGSAVVPAIAAIRRQMKRAEHEAVLGRLVSDLEEGSTLTEAFQAHPRTFDPVYCAIVAAGEASGTLAEMFDRLALMVGKRRAIRKKVIGTFAYPVLLIVMCIHILFVLLMFVLPRFAGMFDQLGVETPASTQLLLACGSFAQTNWPFMAGGAAGLAILGAYLLTSAAGKQWLINIQLSIPILGRLRSRLIQGQIFRTVGTLLESRVDLLDTLALARQATRNRSYQRLFDKLQDTVTSGGQLSAAFDESKLVEPYVCQAVRTGEDSGNLGGAVSYCADILDETNEELIQVVTKLVEPIILIGMGLVVGGVAISLFLPLFDLTSAMN
ncbi:MAG: type II secretion system F family protein [Planctomycetes bacterium]|nr:type II secretion system F family protein [Planctomycetota bacterium]